MAFTEDFWSWSSTSGSNGPSGADNIGTGLDDVLRGIQGGVIRGLSHKGVDVASSTTPALGALDGLYHDITGTATVTGFDTVRAGLLKVVKFEGALTLTHNATNLILPGGTSILTANGDVAIFISEGSGNWRCLSYAPADSGGLIPRGTVVPYAGASAPVGWLLCFGQSLLRTDYAGLFAVISTTYGAADGTHFSLPDLRGRVVAGQDDMGGSSANRLIGVTGSVDGDVLGGTGGAETVTLAIAEMPAHTHVESIATTGGGNQNPTGVASNGTANTDNSTASTGGGGAHNNVQPTLILNYIIKT